MSRQLPDSVSQLSRRSASVGIFTGLFVLSCVSLYLSVSWPLKSVTVGATIHHLSMVKLIDEGVTGVVFIAGYYRDALAAVEQERDAVKVERDAFRDFADEVASISTITSEGVPATTTGLVTRGAAQKQLQSVRDAYRNTVMATEDYEDAYGESLPEHMAKEFSPEIAAAVVEGQKLSGPLQGHLVGQARTAASERGDLLTALDEEHESVSDAFSLVRSAQSPIDRSKTTLLPYSVSDLVAQYETLRQEIKELEQLLEARQKKIHVHTSRTTHGNAPTLQEYLYRSLPVSFPVLAGTLDRIRDLRKDQQTIIESLIRRK